MMSNYSQQLSQDILLQNLEVIQSDVSKCIRIVHIIIFKGSLSNQTSSYKSKCIRIVCNIMFKGSLSQVFKMTVFDKLAT